MENEFIKGRGSQLKTRNKFLKLHYDSDSIDGIDEPDNFARTTKFFEETPKTVVNKVDSPDVFMEYSLNPYQGCEHGCIYCYARNSHQYWGFSSGLDFEQNIIVKKNAPELLRANFEKASWKATTISLSGNTDCYQPAEKKYELTRQLLEIFLEYQNPVGIITKNSLILRDLDILKKLAARNLVHVMISITSLDESLRRLMEPRTASSIKRIDTVRQLSENGIQTGVMIAPIIPGLNSMEIPAIMEKVAEAGAINAGFTIVRLNGDVAELFTNWVHKSFPDRAEKILHQIGSASKVGE